MHTLSTQELAALKSIKDFRTLLTYLQTDLDWPIDTNDVDDLTFDYTPQELGLEQQHVVKLSSIKQLRPLVTNQPWGIFYLEFEQKKLPVVVLRRILRELVPKKRASANPSDRMVWNKHDLLFISSMGEASHRRISFAHFRDDPNTAPVLETFDWDDRETQFNSIGLSLNKLKWPLNPANQTNWRENWASAFTKPHGYTIKTAKELSSALAKLAGRVRDRVREIYDVERKDGPLHKLFEAFKAALVHDLEPKTFADMVAQTVAYGLFTARAETGKVLGLSNLAEMVPATNPFLRELFGEIEKLGDTQESYINFDELGVSEIVTLLNQADINAVLEDFGRQTGGGREDPVIHFYESFLKEYDAEQRVQRGVFYTPQPVVSFIVRSVDQILRDEFGCPDGLADTSTWGDMQERNPDLTLPKGVTATTPFVQVLDPATGTGTFLVEVIDIIWKTMCKKWKTERKSESQILAAWNAYVPKHLLPRINGFELMMASYAIAHVKLGLKLKQTGYDFQSGERLRVFLTNTLEEPDELGAQRTWAKDYNFLAHESRAADSVKRDMPITVVLGNPPYSKMSANLGGYAVELIEPFRFVDGQRIVERGALALEMILQDDYVKFFAFMLRKLSSVDICVSSYISNFRFINSPFLRGMRAKLLSSYSVLDFVNLGGHIAERNHIAGVDENVFDIEQGVAISLMRRSLSGTRQVQYYRMLGSRSEKYDLLMGKQSDTIPYEPVKPYSPLYKFVIGSDTPSKEFDASPDLSNIFPLNSGCIITSRDKLTIDFDIVSLLRKVKMFAYSPKDDLAILEEIGFSVKDKWDVEACKRKLREQDVPEHYIRPILYRPFDFRFIYYFLPLIDTPSRPIASLLSDKRNMVILSPKVKTTTDFSHIFIARVPGEKKSASHDRATQMFPLLNIVPASELLNQDEKIVPNINKSLLVTMQAMLDTDEPIVASEAIFHYIYAVLHSPEYRFRFGDSLLDDFPRLPLTSDVALFRALAAFGEQLTALHLMERTGPNVATFPVKGNNKVEAAPTYTAPGPGRKEGRVSINKTQYFAPVPPDVWEFQVGGYQVCHKWLKDRKGRVLSEEDVTHYGRVVAALGETIRLMAEIDAVIEEHGGWPLQ